MSAISNGSPFNGFSRRLSWAGYLLGFALGGFFDGILLHQILQWHHLLSAVRSAPFQDIKVQILADGLFHVLMYFIALGGLWMLWKARREYAGPGADRRLLANALIGFGVWHVLDGILSHWILGIHRIRMDTENPLLWDLLWLVVFGIVPAAIGWAMRKGNGTGGHSARRSATTAMLLALAVTAAGPIAALPPANVTTVMVFFKPGTPPSEIFNAIDAADGRILWAAGSGDVWALDVKDKSRTGLFYQHGAYLVSNSALAVGCLAWSTAGT